MPKEYKLERQKLLSGYLLFAFGAKPARFQTPIKIAKLVANRLRKTNGPVENIDFSPPDKGRLSVERYGPAEIMLGDYKNDPNPLEAWFRTKYAKAIRGYGFEVTSHTDAEDERLTLIGEQTRLYDGVPFSPVLVLDKAFQTDSTCVSPLALQSVQSYLCHPVHREQQCLPDCPKSR